MNVEPAWTTEESTIEKILLRIIVILFQRAGSSHELLSFFSLPLGFRSGCFHSPAPCVSLPGMLAVSFMFF